MKNNIKNLFSIFIILTVSYANELINAGPMVGYSTNLNSNQEFSDLI